MNENHGLLITMYVAVLDKRNKTFYILNYLDREIQARCITGNQCGLDALIFSVGRYDAIMDYLKALKYTKIKGSDK